MCIYIYIYIMYICIELEGERRTEREGGERGSKPERCEGIESTKLRCGMTVKRLAVTASAPLELTETCGVWHTAASLGQGLGFP